MSLKKGVILILSANIVNMLFNLLTSFMLPKFLTLDCYAEIKTYQLYIGYCGFLHLGYADGMYIKYGGKTINDIDKKDLGADIQTLFVFQIVITILCLIPSLVMSQFTLVACVMSILPLNMVAYYKLLLQAVGDFKPYARLLNLTVTMNLAANVILLAMGFHTNYHLYLVLYVIVEYVVLIICSVVVYRQEIIVPFGSKPRFQYDVLNQNVQKGFLLMLGNFSSMILTGMDRWFIKALMNNVAFAQYSFAVSLEGLMNVAVTPVSTTLYNYFCVYHEDQSLHSIKNKIVLFASILISCMYPAKFVVEMFLSNYNSSIDVITWLFAGQLYFIIVKCFYVNLYKAEKKQNVYFAKLAGIICVGAVFNVILYFILRAKEAFAIGTMMCGVVWLILSERDFKSIRLKNGETCYLLLISMTFILTGIYLKAIVGFVLYVGAVGLFAMLFLKKEFIECLQIVKKMIHRERA